MNCKQNFTPWSRAMFIAVVIFAFSVLAVGQTERVVHLFQGGSDGFDPQGSLISDSAGNLYGTTYVGGANNGGTLFELSPPSGSGGWTKTVLYNFCAQSNCSDGVAPFGELVFDQAGNFYGTVAGACNIYSGVLERKAPASPGDPWTESLIYNVAASTQPVDGLAFDQAGNLYRVTNHGGAILREEQPAHMTQMEVAYRYGANPGPAEMRALGSVREVYGIRRMKFEKGQIIRVEFDASRLKEPAVASLLREAGFELKEKLT